MGDISTPAPSWQDIAARKRRQRDAHIPIEWRVDVAKYEGLNSLLHVPQDCGLLSERELKITEQHDAVAIVEKIRDGVFTVEDVITAFCKRAAIIQQVVRGTRLIGSYERC
jgi:amidase